MTCWRWLLAAVPFPVLIGVAFVAAPAGPASACTAAAVGNYYPGSTLETAPIVVVGRVTNASGPAFDLEVEETLRGSVTGEVVRLSNLFPAATGGSGADCVIKNAPGRYQDGVRLIVFAPENQKPGMAIPYGQYGAAIIDGDAVSYGHLPWRAFPVDEFRAAIARPAVTYAGCVLQKEFSLDEVTAAAEEATLAIIGEVAVAGADTARSGSPNGSAGQIPATTSRCGTCPWSVPTKAALERPAGSNGSTRGAQWR